MSAQLVYLIQVGEVLGGEVDWLAVEDNVLEVLSVVEPCAHTSLAYGLSAGHLRTNTRSVTIR